jgi:hypothetical protein
MTGRNKGGRTLTLDSLHTRLTALEGQTYAAGANAAPDAPLLHASVPDETRSLEFSLAKGSAQQVRVTLDHTEVVLFGTWSTPSSPRKNGDWVSVLIEVLGNPGDRAILDITNSDPAQLKSAAIPKGTTHIADPRLIVAKWT